ncbi:hypothetical protein ACFL6I_21375 [candidate division KSB1 bacterium]
MNGENRMADGEQFHSRLARFTGDQKNMIADMAAADCVLKEIWEAAVFAFITGNEWHPGDLWRSINDRITEITQELMNDDITFLQEDYQGDNDL